LLQWVNALGCSFDYFCYLNFHLSLDVDSFLSGDFLSLYGSPATLKHFELAFLVHNGRNVIQQLLPPVMLLPGSNKVPEFTIPDVFLDTGIVLVALVRAVLSFSGSSLKTCSVGTGWLPLPLATCSNSGAVLTGSVRGSLLTSPLPSGLCCPIAGHSHVILKSSASAATAASFSCRIVCASDDENMPLEAPDALGVPRQDDFADEGDVLPLQAADIKQQLDFQQPADEDVIADSSAIATSSSAPAVAVSQRVPPPVVPRCSSATGLAPPHSSTLSTASAAARPNPPSRLLNQPSHSQRAALPHSVELEALMHVTFSFELRGEAVLLQVDIDQPFTDFRSCPFS
jgi:hypothetical protein